MKVKSNLGAAKGWHSRGYLPHFDSPEVVQHIVLRTADSLPAATIAALPRDARLRRQRIDESLDLGYGAALLREIRVASIVEAALLYFDGQRYRLIVWSIMPNHVHILVEALDGFPLDKIIHSWKSFTAHEINKLTGRSGPVWAVDYFDRFMRDEEHFHATVGYIEQNPVKARLVGSAEEWRFSSARRRVALEKP